MKTTTPLLAIAVLLGTVSAIQAEPGRMPMHMAQTTPQATPPVQPMPAPQDKQSGAAAWSMLVGNTVVGTLDGKEVVDYYHSDGTVKSSVAGQVLAGKWTLEGEKICFAYPSEPKECYAMEVSGDSATFTDPSGSKIATKIFKGNARNM